MTENEDQKRFATLTQRMFCEELFGESKGNLAEAYRRTHPNFIGSSADAAHRGYLFKQRIIGKIGYGEFLVFAGLTDEHLAGRLKELTNSEDDRVSVQAVKLGFQTRRKFVEKSEVELSAKKSFTDVLKEQNTQQAEEPDDDA